jgi:hypothetical protein
MKRVFQEEPGGASPEGVEDVLVEVERREDQNARRGQPVVAGDASGEFDAVHLRHPDVHQDDVGPLPNRELHGAASIGGFPDHVDVGGAAQQHGEAAPHEGLVVVDATRIIDAGASSSTALSLADRPFEVTPGRLRGEPLAFTLRCEACGPRSCSWSSPSRRAACRAGPNRWRI